MKFKLNEAFSFLNNYEFEDELNCIRLLAVDLAKFLFCMDPSKQNQKQIEKSVQDYLDHYDLNNNEIRVLFCIINAALGKDSFFPFNNYSFGEILYTFSSNDILAMTAILNKIVTEDNKKRKALYDCIIYLNNSLRINITNNIISKKEWKSSRDFSMFN